MMMIDDDDDNDYDDDWWWKFHLHTGGKCLPSEITYPVSEAPFEIKQRLEEAEGLDRMRMRRGLPPKQQPHQRSSNLGAAELLAEQISQEINERREYLEEMSQLGSLSSAEERKIKAEISQRVHELQSLDKNLWRLFFFALNLCRFVCLINS